MGNKTGRVFCWLKLITILAVIPSMKADASIRSDEILRKQALVSLGNARCDEKLHSLRLLNRLEPDRKSFKNLAFGVVRDCAQPKIRSRAILLLPTGGDVKFSPSEVEVLRSELGSASPVTRSATAYFLATAGLINVRSILDSLEGVSDDEERIFFCGALDLLGGEATSCGSISGIVTKSALELLKVAIDEFSRKKAFILANLFPEQAIHAITCLLEFVDHSGDRYKDALQSLKKQWIHSRIAAIFPVTLLEDRGSVNDKLARIRFLENMSPEALSFLGEALKSADLNTRLEAVATCRAIGEGAAEVSPALEALVFSEAYEIRRQAALALIEVNPDRAEALIRRMLELDPDLAVELSGMYLQKYLD